MELLPLILQAITVTEYLLLAGIAIAFYQQWKCRRILKKYKDILDKRSATIDERSKVVDERSKFLDERTEQINSYTEQLNEYSAVLNKRAALFVTAKAKLEAEYGVELEDDAPEEKTVLH